MARELRFDGQVVIVTGAAGGLGRSQAVEFGRRGAHVVLNDLGGSPNGGGGDRSLVEAIAARVRETGAEALASDADISTPEGGRRVVDEALARWGRVDAIVTNAGIQRNQLFEDVGPDDWDDVLAVNLSGVFHSIQPAYRAMKAAGRGRIVTITSTSGLCGGYGQSNYGAAKSGVVGLTRSLAWEGAQHGVKANMISPGALDTRLRETFTADNAAVADRPPDLAFVLDGDVPALWTADRVTPMAVALAHESCPTTAEMYTAIGGYYARLWIAESDGFVAGLEPTAEDVADHWDEIVGAGTPGTEVEGETLVWSNRRFDEKLGALARTAR
jgi:NAD(P)-dependent dehydrogenase (short-subunit alcohol dehydrogenase family)